ncbi:hypothetical protein GXW82_20815 [Streptacidiphilus sp. 4-A2]|nr:hypothetical protein [Streptacidiphilus sp. 4-A2]
MESTGTASFGWRTPSADSLDGTPIRQTAPPHRIVLLLPTNAARARVGPERHAARLAAMSIALPTGLFDGPAQCRVSTPDGRDADSLLAGLKATADSTARSLIVYATGQLSLGGDEQLYLTAPGLPLRLAHLLGVRWEWITHAVGRAAAPVRLLMVDVEADPRAWAVLTDAQPGHAGTGPDRLLADGTSLWGRSGSSAAAGRAPGRPTTPGRRRSPPGCGTGCRGRRPCSLRRACTSRCWASRRPPCSPWAGLPVPAWCTCATGPRAGGCCRSRRSRRPCATPCAAPARLRQARLRQARSGQAGRRKVRPGQARPSKGKLMRHQVLFRVLPVVAIAVAAPAGCAAQSGQVAQIGAAPSGSAAPSPSQNPAQAATAQVLAAYTGMRQAQAAAEDAGSVQNVPLGDYAGGKALVEIISAVGRTPATTGAWSACRNSTPGSPRWTSPPGRPRPPSPTAWTSAAGTRSTSSPARTSPRPPRTAASCPSPRRNWAPTAGGSPRPK